MKIIMMGCGPFAVPTFRLLAQQPNHQVELLISQPVREKKRPVDVSPTVRAAAELNIPVWQPDRINDNVDQLRSYNADLFVVCDFGQILSPDVLASAPLGGLNLHGSLLPKYRGAAPINRAIMAGETTLGVTVIHLTPQLDAGPMVAQASLELGSDETALQVEPRLAELGAPLVLSVVNKMNDGNIISQLQPEGQATRAPKLKKAEGKIDWSLPAEQIRNLYRAFEPWPQTHFFWTCRGNQLRLIPRSVPTVEFANLSPDAAPGTVLEVSDRLVIQTGAGAIAFTRIQPAGKKEMDIKSFTLGYAIHPGEKVE